MASDPEASAAVRLVCCPHAGGFPVTYRRLRDRLPRFVDVLVVRPPGRFGNPGPPALSVDAVAAGAAEAVAVIADRPVVLLGHSFGATVAFECAVRLGADGVPVALLVVSGRDAPGLARPVRLHTAGDAELAGELSRFGGTPVEVLAGGEVLTAVLPLVRADFRLLAEHPVRRSVRVSCPLVAFGGTEDRTTTRDGVAGWAAFAGAL